MQKSKLKLQCTDGGNDPSIQLPSSCKEDSESMIGENRQLVTDEPVEVEIYRSRFTTAGKLLVILEEFMEYASIY